MYIFTDAPSGGMCILYVCAPTKKTNIFLRVCLGVRAVVATLPTRFTFTTRKLYTHHIQVYKTLDCIRLHTYTHTLLLNANAHTCTLCMPNSTWLRAQEVTIAITHHTHTYAIYYTGI